MILVPLFALGYPIFDTLLAIARRVFRGQPLFASDRDHIHHRLLDRGRTPSAAAIQIYIASVIISLVCIAAMTANHFVLGLIVVGVLVMALFSARVLGYLEWGGWTAQWTGRQETKILHAAAQLARLKMDAGESEDDLVNALGTLATEMDCGQITLTSGHQICTWHRHENVNPVTPDHAQVQLLEKQLGGDRILRLYFSPEKTPMGEPLTLLEELCERLDRRFSHDKSVRQADPQTTTLND